MSDPVKLDAAQKHILRLIARDAKPDGWATVSRVLYDSVSQSIPSELAVFVAPTGEGFGLAKLTTEGRNVVNSMLWL